MYGKVIFICSVLLLFFLLVACSPAAGSHSGAPTLVTAKSVRGEPGSGPVVMSSSGGNTNGQQVALKDRTLVLNSVSKQDNTDGHSSLVTLALTVRNTSDKPILNQSSFFQLMSAEGDTFTYQYKSSDNFYDVVPAHSSRDGAVVFLIPKAAASHVQLLYRPEVVMESVLMLLTV